MYQHLGKKALYLFILERSSIPIGAFFLGILVFIGMSLPIVHTAIGLLGENPMGPTIPGVDTLLGMIAPILLAFAAIGEIYAIIVGTMIYENYQFLLGDDSLKIKTGIFLKKEIAIPYRQIQDVSIKRDFSYQILGLSQLIILTAGEGEVSGSGRGVLQALDRDIATQIQNELLKRAETQKVMAVPHPSREQQPPTGNLTP